jgi:hypothetical protein
MHQILLPGLLAAVCLGVQVSAAQDSHEALGPQDHPGKKAPSPLVALMETRQSALLPALRGQHPRVFFTNTELDALRKRAHSTHAALWARALGTVRALQVAPPAPPAETRRAQNEVALGIAEAAFAYRIEGDKKYLDAARRYMDAAVGYTIWGYASNKPNVDLAAGHLLYGMGMGYDLLYADLTEAERKRYRDTIASHARLLFDYFQPRPGRTCAYSQNHVFIPIAGLGIAAYAVYDEVSDAPRWAALARAIFDRTLATYSPDGYYYEGFEYWIFSTPWIVHYLDAHKHSTGEDLFDQPGLKAAHLYAAHSLLPGGQSVFDFGDVFEGPLTRARQEPEYSRTHPGGKFHTNYNLLFDLAARFHDPEIQGVARWMESLGHVNAEEWWSLVWYDDKLAAAPIQRIPAWHYFADHEVAYWRTGWGADAAALAFKCGPPEGHHTAQLLPQFPDWHLSSGHSHPDANSFILFAKGEYLTGDSGYSGVPRTDQHNTLLVDGRGQGNDGRQQHDPWDGFAYSRLNTVRITGVKATADSFEVEGEASGAYDPALGLERFTRHLRFTAADGVTIADDIRSGPAHVFTELIHSDTTLTPRGERRYEIAAGKARLMVSWDAPANSTARVEPNIVTAPGPPGSVSDGEPQHRGNRLAVSSERSTQAEFRWVLR